MLIASKYEEIYPNTVNELIPLAEATFTKSEILKMENLILFNIQFEI